MIRDLISVLKELPEHMDITAATSAADYPVNVCDERKSQYLPEDQEHNFHHTMSQLSFVSAQACQYIQTSV